MGDASRTGTTLGHPPTDTPASRRGRAGWLLLAGAVTVAVGFLALVGIALRRGETSTSSLGGVHVNAVGQLGRVQSGQAPDFELQLYAGGTLRLSAQRGKVVLVNYWASWCPPCREEAPVLERAWQRYQDRGVVLVGVDVWDAEQDARKFLRDFTVDYPNGLDSRGSAAIDYGVTGIPETFFIRPDGTMARHWIGPMTDQQIGTLIQEMLP